MLAWMGGSDTRARDTHLAFRRQVARHGGASARQLVQVRRSSTTFALTNFI
jgi:hypothetical protein